MYNKQKLKAELVLRDMSMADFAQKLNMNKSTLNRKINGKSEWSLSEIQSIKSIIGDEQTYEIFFGDKVS